MSKSLNISSPGRGISEGESSPTITNANIILSYNKATNKDHLVRLHKMSCCIADKASKLADKIKLGLSCEKDKLTLEVLVAYYDALKCYQTETPSRSVGSFRLAKNSTIITGETVELYINGVLICSVVAVNDDLYDLLVSIMDEINNNTSTPEDYTAIFDGVDTITIYSVSTDNIINGYPVVVLTDTDYLISFDIRNMQEGNDGADINCLTQIQVNKIWDHVAKLCGLCFAPYGSQYIDPTLTDESIFTFFRIIQEDGNYILQENNSFIKTENNQ